MRCPRSVPWLYSGSAGALVAAGWWLFVDAVLVGGGIPSVTLAWLTPGLLACFAGCLASLAPLEHLQGHSFRPEAAPCVRCWLFCTFTLSFLSIVIGLGFVTGEEYAVDDLTENATFPHNTTKEETLADGKSSAWPAVAVMGQAVLIFAGSLCWMTARTSPGGFICDASEDEEHYVEMD